MTDQKSGGAAMPSFALLVMCVECGQGIEAILPIDQASLSLLLAQQGWFVSVLTPPEQPSGAPHVGPVAFAALCGTCAPKIFPPEVLKAAKEAQQAVLRSAQGSR